MKKIISIATSCYNEEENIDILYARVVKIFDSLSSYEYELVISDNNSTDGTVEKLRAIANRDKRVKVMLNMINYGHVRSPINSMINTSGDVVVAMASDLEDPPELIPEFIAKWECGYKIVAAVRTGSEEPGLIKYLRMGFYYLMRQMSDVRQIPNFTGFGLYDREVVNQIIEIDDPNPYFRGIVCDLGYEVSQVKYHKPYRTYGQSKGRFFTNYELAIQGMVKFSKFPLRFITIFGLFVSLSSFILAIFYLFQKLLHWQTYQAGITPILLLVLFLFGTLFLMLGFLGEYISLLIGYVIRKPKMIIKEKINFDSND